MNSREKILSKIAIALAVLLVIKVLISILWEYRYYFPPDFDKAYFLAGRRLSFAGWYSFGFYLHIISGPIALVAVLAMLATGKSKRFRNVHRTTGKLLALLTVIAVCPGGLIMAFKSIGGPIATYGFCCLAFATVFSVLATAHFARKKQIKAHMDWAYRSAILLCSPIALRLSTGLFAVTNVESLNTYRATVWFSWILPLVIFEIVRIQKGR